MQSLSDLIEAYIKERLEREGGVLALRRSTLAEQFRCAPSQINYVLATRFTLERGYMVESRRGGGGYIRVIRLELGRAEPVFRLLHSRIGDRISQDRAEGLIDWLAQEGILSEREAAIVRAAMDRDCLGMDLPARDAVRARLLKAMVAAALRARG